VEPDELSALGVYDPQGPDAELRLELLNLLVSLGATGEELVTFQDSLPALAGVLAIRGGPALTLEESSLRSGLTTGELRDLALTAGLPDPEPDVPVFTESFVAFASMVHEVAAVFGQQACTQLIRVLAAAMARVADAMVSSFLVNVASPAYRMDPVGLGVARANAEVGALLPVVAPALEALLRQHLLMAQRMVGSGADVGEFETRQLAVGFVDLVGSTELGEKVDLSELGATLIDFERIASQAIIEGGGRVVKLIGDEILFTAPDALTASSIALDLADAFQGHPTVPQIRAGLASGEVMLRDGDVFGPVVNLASRIVGVAQAGEVVTTPEVAIGTGLPSESLGVHRLSGILGDRELHRLSRL
jgi:adenylate cyclase